MQSILSIPDWGRQMQIDIRVSGDAERLARQLGEDVLDGFDWESLAPVVAEHAERIFRTQGGGQWQQLNPQYAAWKSRRYPGSPILVRTGQYLAAATNPGAPHNIVETTENSITYGVGGIDYAVFHEEGRGRLPERPVFALLEGDQELRDDATDALSEFIEEKLSRR